MILYSIEAMYSAFQMTTKMSDVLKSLVEQSDILTNFGADFQTIVSPVSGYIMKSLNSCAYKLFIFCVKL